MAILSQEEFNQQSSSGKHSLEKIFQGKSIEAGPVFSLDNLQAAELYCERFGHKQQARICLIVKEKNFIRIWTEIAQGHNNDSLPESLATKNKASINALPLTTEFTDFCQKLLAEQIGPIAEMICKKTLNKKPNLDRIEFVDILAKKISNPIQANDFKQAALE